MDSFNLGKPIGALSGHTVPLNGFDQGEHGAGTGLAGGHVPSSTNQAKGYGQDSQSGFNSGLGGEHASGGLPGQGQQKTPIADKFMGNSSSSDNTVSGAYAGSGTSNALTGSSHAHTTGAGVGPLGENLRGGEHSSHSGGALAGASALGAGGLASHGHSSGTGVGVGAVGGSGGHYSTEGQHGTSSLSGNNASSGISGNNSNIGSANSAGVLGAQQAGARGTHGDSGLAGVGAGAVGAGALGAGAAGAHSHSHSHDKDQSGMHSSKHIDDHNSKGEPLSNPKDLDSGSRHGLVFDKATGKYEHRHVIEGDRDGDKK